MDIQNDKWKTVGHAQAKRILEAQLRGNTLSHAYLFMGSAGLGKSVLAQEFAGRIISGGSVHNIVIHDLHANGSIEEVRELLHLASLTPIDGNRKVVILKNADRISDSSANALLKTLEEPPAHTYFILVSNRPRILATIMSRCQIVNCSRLSDEEMRGFAVTRKLESIEEFLAVAGGNPERMEMLATGDDHAKEIMAKIAMIEPAIKSGDFERMILVKNLADLEDDVLTEVLSGWVHRQIAELQVKPQRFSAVRIALECITRLKHSFNKKMVLEYFVTNTSL